jgi:hypothetical protein
MIGAQQAENGWPLPQGQGLSGVGFSSGASDSAIVPK